MGETTPVPSVCARVLGQPPTASRKRGVGSDGRTLCESRGPERLEPFRPAVGRHMLGHEATDLGGEFESMTAEANRDEETLAPDSIQAQTSGGHTIQRNRQTAS